MLLMLYAEYKFATMCCRFENPSCPISFALLWIDSAWMNEDGLAIRDQSAAIALTCCVFPYCYLLLRLLVYVYNTAVN